MLAHFPRLSSSVSVRKIIMKKHLLLYAVVLIAILVKSHYIPRFTNEMECFFNFSFMTIGAFIVSIIIRIVLTKKINLSKKLYYLSGIPFLIIATHISIFIFGDFYAEQGFYWILYALIIIGVPFSIFFCLSGAILKSRTSNKS